MEEIKIKVKKIREKSQTKAKTRRKPKLKLLDEEKTLNLDEVIKKLKSLGDSDEYKSFLSRLEVLNHESLNALKSTNDKFASLYPHIDDPLFNVKLVQKK